MKKLCFAVLLGSSVIALSGCGGGKSAISEGQTIARVDGTDITIHELNAELKGIPLPQGEQRKKIEQLALQQIVDRKILASIAREQKLDQTPDFILLKQKSEDALLAQLLQQKLAGGVKRPSPTEVSGYISSNPNLFAQHKIYVLDQISFPMGGNPQKLKELVPLKTLDQIEQWLIANGLEYRRLPASLDAAQFGPDMVNKIAGLPAGEVFVAPVGQVVTASVITSTRAAPVTGDAANSLATRILQNKSLSDTAGKQLEKDVLARRAKVTYQAGYSAPPKPPAQPTAAAPVAAPAAAPAATKP